MIGLGALAFETPAILLALAALPILWWLLRVRPPAPKREIFPPIRFLAELTDTDESAERTPPWILIFRLILAGLIILGLAGPIRDPAPRLPTEGPLVIVIDNGWSAAADWPARQSILGDILTQAEIASRPVAIAATATAEPQDVIFLGAREARDIANGFEPMPYPPQRLDLIEPIARVLAADTPAQIIWISDNINHGAGAPFAAQLAGLSTAGPLQVITPAQLSPLAAITDLSLEAGDLNLTLTRPNTGQTTPDQKNKTRQSTVAAYDLQGSLLAREPFSFSAEETHANLIMSMPVELRNDIARLEIENQNTAGAVWLMDERWRRRTVRLKSSGSLESTQPLLAPTYYLERALQPFAQIIAPEAQALQPASLNNLSLLILADVGHLKPDEKETVDAWVSEGGTLLRFAGPRLAASGDDLLPVDLRRGGRMLGGALTWAEPQPIAAFESTSPFYGLAIPEDVTVAQQVLAEPSVDLTGKVWARLADGTPLVTARKHGAGRLILFHTTANTDWSNLALSGLFVNMLRRVTDTSPIPGSPLQAKAMTTTAEPGDSYSPLLTLDGHGRLAPPPPTAQGLRADQWLETRAGPGHPPGIYRRGEQRHTLNLAPTKAHFAAFDSLPSSAEQISWGLRTDTRLGAWLLALALILAIADAFLALSLAGRLPVIALPKFMARITPVLLLPLIAFAPGAQAQEQTSDDAFALKATIETRLAYVITGDPETDEMGRAGMEGLSEVLRQRTAVEPGAPVGLRPDHDEMLFFPFIYWPVISGAEPLSADTARKTDAYLRSGGTILFDTRDQGLGPVADAGASTNTQTKALARLLENLDVPPLAPLPYDHVLTKSFYLLQEFPGRWTGGQLWVEATPRDGTPNDGVSPIIIGSNDYAAAWARDSFGAPMAQLVPGGQRQREMAIRTGINLVIYALTGNYKTDQVHIPALLERLGQ